MVRIAWKDLFIKLTTKGYFMANVKKINEIYRCNICGNIVEVLNVGGGQLVCCGKPMEKLIVNILDADIEKHVPVIEKSSDGYIVKIGSKPHPMINKHYIKWIELIVDKISYKKFLNPGDKPEALFCIKSKKLVAKAYCNIHGLWKK